MSEALVISVRLHNEPKLERIANGRWLISLGDPARLRGRLSSEVCRGIRRV